VFDHLSARHDIRELEDVHVLAVRQLTILDEERCGMRGDRYRCSAPFSIVA
jgi:hypothetical protein